jgi:hypothetical protein
MSSSRATAVVSKPVSSDVLLVELLAGLPDPRARRGRRHPVGALVAVALCAILTGARSFTAIAEWARDAGRPRLRRLGMMRRAADEATFRRVLTRLDPAALEKACIPNEVEESVAHGEYRCVRIIGINCPKFLGPLKS